MSSESLAMQAALEANNHLSTLVEIIKSTKPSDAHAVAEIMETVCYGMNNLLEVFELVAANLVANPPATPFNAKAAWPIDFQTEVSTADAIADLEFTVKESLERLREEMNTGPWAAVFLACGLRGRGCEGVSSTAMVVES